jgi:hypothetical protein
MNLAEKTGMKLMRGITTAKIEAVAAIKKCLRSNRLE